MSYLTYKDYTDMGGSVQEAAFNILEFKARKKIDYYTQNRLVGTEAQDVSEVVKHLMFALIQNCESIGNQNISSASNDGVSVTYLSSADISANDEELIKTYLSGEYTADGTPLLYAGVV